jgi:hypothetical protein
MYTLVNTMERLNRLLREFCIKRIFDWVSKKVAVGGLERRCIGLGRMFWVGRCSVSIV